MNLKPYKSIIEYTPVDRIYTKTGKFSKYEMVIYLYEPYTVKRISDKDYSILMDKKKATIESFNNKRSKYLKDLDIKQKQEKSEELTKLAISKIESINNILNDTLLVDDRVNWEDYLSKEEFEKKQSCKYLRFDKKGKPISYVKLLINDEPKIESYTDISIFWTLLGLKKWKIEKQTSIYNENKLKWKSHKKETELNNNKREEDFKSELDLYEIEKTHFLEKQNEKNNKVLFLKSEYESESNSSVEEYTNLVLTASKYPEFLNMSFDIVYNPENKMILIDMNLPSLDSVPNIDLVKYIKAKDILEEKKLSTKKINDLYDSLIYQICLRTIHEVFESDYINYVESINFNGMLKDIDKSTGKMKKSCIASIQVTKEEFLEINLDLIDPKECFKSLKGVSAAKLHSLTPIKPILKLNKEDSRFIDSYDVINDVDDSINLAAMGWEDFEHLVRELFSKEFAADGGEVKITQSSSDGGVDAIAFDPDPIRGGKIVIQAKRYTNVVGVAAVRDLYGTVMNEGANKGILVTTSNYGSDSYKFAQEKPLTLINGNELLYLLEKHGNSARIDLKEAKEMLK